MIGAPLLVLLLAPWPALCIGLLVMSGAGLPSSIRALNAAAASVGLLAVLLAWRRPLGFGRAGPRRWTLTLGLALLGSTLLAPGVEGVHRWLPLGPVQVHAGAVVLPPMLVVLAGCGSAASAAVAIVALVLLALQPDPAQAVSFTAGWIVLVAGKRDRAAILGAVVVAVLAGASLLRAAPLAPVPHVEGIVGLAAARGLPWAAAGVASLVVLPLSLLLVGGRRELALAAYMASTTLAAWLGDYPVPILGHGVSPVLGYYAALVALGSARPYCGGEASRSV